VGPGQDITREILKSRWQSMGPRKDIIDFYSHHWNSMGEWAVFSNFFVQGQWPGAFDFQVPLAFCACDISEQERVVTCDFSEKAIMLCKAAASGDMNTYRMIAKAERPQDAKHLASRNGPLRGFDQDLWSRIDCSVAFQVVFQKFSKTPELKNILLKYEGLYAEMTSNDVNWGTGIDRRDPLKTDPSKWKGDNMLGWALTEVRALLVAAEKVDLLREQLLAQEAEIGGKATADVPAILDEPAASSSTSTGGASNEAKHAAVKNIFKYVSGVLNAAFGEDSIVNIEGALALWSSTNASFPAACDALADAIDEGVVPDSGLQTLLGLSGELSRHGVLDSARLPQVLERVDQERKDNRKVPSIGSQSGRGIGSRWGQKK